MKRRRKYRGRCFWCGKWIRRHHGHPDFCSDKCEGAYVANFLKEYPGWHPYEKRGYEIVP
jgi:hypothetical protein